MILNDIKEKCKNYLSVTLKTKDTFNFPDLNSKSQIITINEYDENTKFNNEGFTLYESSTLKEIFNF